MAEPTRRKSSLEGFSICVAKPEPRAVRLKHGKGAQKGLTWLEHLHYDEGTKKWVVVQRTLRPDLAKQRGFLIPLTGEESNAEVDEYIGLASDPRTDAWFERKERPNWAKIEQLVNDIYDQRKQQIKHPGRTQFWIPGRN